MVQIDDDRQRRFQKISGHNFQEGDWPPLSFDVPYSLVADKERQIVQTLEVMSITAAADAIEMLLQEKGLSSPAIYSILTAGMDVPAGATLLGRYGEQDTAFASFPKTDIYGHAGEVFALETEPGQTMLILKGRAHPYEWDKDPYGDMVVAHPLQVLKEMARRSRAASGLDPVFILTYLTGVRDGLTMVPGDLGVIFDDSPFDTGSHPGHGPRAILDKFAGERFQPKDGRASTMDVARLFIDFARGQNIALFPAAAVGTPGATEYQSSMEATLFDQAFAAALAEGNFGRAVREVANDEQAALLFCMGVTEELATMRQTHGGERGFKVLALGLATDAVGGAQSTEINHQEVVEAAFARGEMYRNLIVDFINSQEFAHLIAAENPLADHSIKKKLAD